MNIVIVLRISVAAGSILSDLFAIVWGHDLMPPYGGYSGEWDKFLCDGGRTYRGC